MNKQSGDHNGRAPWAKPVVKVVTPVAKTAGGIFDFVVENALYRTS